MTKSKIFVLTLISFVTGIAIANFFILNLFFIFCALLILIFFLIVFWSKYKLRIFFILLIFLGLGIYRYQISLPNINDDSKIYYYNNNQSIEFSGRIQKVDTRIDHQKITIDVKKITNNSKSVSGLVLVNTNLYPAYNVGDIVSIQCQLKVPTSFDDFAYDKYLARYSIYSVCGFADINIINYSSYNFLSLIKSKLEISLNKSIVEPQVSIIQAMLLGNRRNIPASILADISTVGLSHIIAISGMHIAIIVMIVVYSLIALGIIRQKAFWVTLVIITFYVALIGYPASAVRGAVMAMLVLYANKIGRLNYSINAILLAASAMLLINPRLLLADVGFQLSFMAVLGIIYLSPILKYKFRQLPELGQLKNMVVVTLSAQIMTLPLIVYYFNYFSLLSIVSNILVLPVLPLIMIWSMIVGVVGIFAPMVANFFGYGSYFLISYVLLVTKLVSRASIFKIELYFDQFYFGALAYLVIFIVIRRYRYLINY